MCSNSRASKHHTGLFQERHNTWYYRDCRWFAGVYLLLRIIFIAIGAQAYHLIVYQVVFIITPAIILSLRPYKKDRYNYFDVFLLLVFAMGLSLYNYREVFKNIRWIIIFSDYHYRYTNAVHGIVHFINDIYSY